MRGERKREYPEAEIQKMQALHIDNLGRLWKEKTAMLAGPLGDAGDLRGIVVMKRRTPEQLKADFEPDPYVRKGLLKVEAYDGVGAPLKTFEPTTPMELQDMSIAFLRKPADAKADPGDWAKPHQAWVRKLSDQGSVAISATLKGPTNLTEVVVFWEPDLAKVKAWAEQDPAARAGQMRWDVFRNYVAKGVLKKP